MFRTGIVRYNGDSFGLDFFFYNHNDFGDTFLINFTAKIIIK